MTFINYNATLQLRNTERVTTEQTLAFDNMGREAKVLNLLNISELNFEEKDIVMANITILAFTAKIQYCNAWY